MTTCSFAFPADSEVPLYSDDLTLPDFSPCSDILLGYVAWVLQEVSAYWPGLLLVWLLMVRLVGSGS